MENEAEFEPVEIVSKSQLKRDSLALQALGKRLAALSPEVLDRLPLDPALREAIALAQRIGNKRSALKRQYQFIGKLLRARDVAPITAALDAHEHQGRESIRRHHRAEQWRDRIVAEGDAAIDATTRPPTGKGCASCGATTIVPAARRSAASTRANSTAKSSAASIRTDPRFRGQNTSYRNSGPRPPLTG